MMPRLWTRSAPRRSWIFAFIAMICLISSLVAPAQAATVTPAPSTTTPPQQTVAAQTTPATTLSTQGATTTPPATSTVPSTPPASATAPPGGTGNLAIDKYACPAGHDASSATLADLRANCTAPLAGIPFAVGSAGMQLASGVTQTDPNSGQTGVDFNNLPTNTPLTVSETIPAGYAAPVVFCQQPGAGTPPSQQMAVSPDGSIALTIPDGQYRTCFWFNVPVTGATIPATMATATAPPTTATVVATAATAMQPTNTGRVTVAKYACPLGFDAGSASLTDLTAQCATPMAGVIFTLTAGGNATQKTTATLNGKSTAQFDSVPAGNLTLQETIPGDDGTPVVYCLVRPLNKLGIPVTSRIPVSPDGTISGSLPADDELVCAWFNVPQAGTPTATSTATGTATAPAKPTAGLIVQKVNCPPGTDPTTVTLAGIQATCTTAGTGITFTVSHGGGQLATGITKTANPNDHIASVIFPPLPAETVTIRESIPNGFGQPVAFCGNIVNGQISNIQRMTVTNGAVAWNLNAAAQNICAFADIPASAGSPTPPSGSGVITIDKTACPAGYDASSATLAQLKADCTAPLAGITFTVTSGTTQLASGTTTADPNTGATGVIFSHLPTGTPLTVSETIPAGYATPVVYCQQPGAGTPPSQRMAVSPDGSIDVTIPSGQYRTCFWFNVPAPRSTVTVHKWLCPAGHNFTPPIQSEDLVTNCTQKQDGVDFTLTDTSTSLHRTTANGIATWTEVSAGPITVSEAIPDGFGTPLVNCYVTEPQKAGGITPGPVTAPHGNFSTILDPGMSLFCDWYNFQRNQAQLTVHKWTCPPGFNLTSGNPTTDCTQATNGITFTASSPNGYSAQATSGAFHDGAAEWGELAPGTYTVTEQVPADTELSFVSDCTGLSTSAVHPYPLATGRTLQIDVAAGDRIDCNWYNVPLRPTGNLTIHKQACADTTFVSTLDCQAFSGGQKFGLTTADGSALVAQGTTDNRGLLTFVGLQPGTYTLQEKNRTWCAVGAPSLDSAALQALPQHGIVTVTANTTLDVWVYNCNIKPAPVTPTAYPNTGAGPMSGPGGPGATLPLALGLLAAALTLGALWMSGLFRSVRLRLPRRALPAALAGSLLAASVALPLTMNARAQPLTTTPNSCATTARVLPRAASDMAKAELEANTAGILATAALNPVCHDMPVAITVNAAHIKAKVEVAEIDGGVMQAPTSPQVVAWYKSSPRLGQPGNMLMAGHLNWWGVPEGVFFYLNTLKPGDRIQLTGQDGAVYTYKVRWNKQVDATKPPTSDIVGPTKTPSLTLITCGGPWDASTSEYTQRTVVRAELVSITLRK